MGHRAVSRNIKEEHMLTKRFHPIVLSRTIIVAMLLLFPAVGSAQVVRPLKTAVIKSSTGLCAKGQLCHKDQAGTWIPSTKVGIVGVSISEQTDVTLYVDIEVSTKPMMYQCGAGGAEDAIGCIFRTKYVGPGLFDYGATSGSTYVGSNITNTNITFPAGYGIVVKAGVPVYVHLDVINHSLIDITVDQDAWIYYIPLR
jgi:hypothetical protein